MAIGRPLSGAEFHTLNLLRRLERLFAVILLAVLVVEIWPAGWAIELPAEGPPVGRRP
jgi:hypothetical protein